MRIFIVATSILCLSACASQPSASPSKPVLREATKDGGRVVQARESMEAGEIAEAHCRAFGRTAMIKSLSTQDGGSIFFDCVDKKPG